MRIAQITDSHLTAPGTLWKGRVNMAGQLARAVARINALTPDLVIHSGDVVERGTAEEYALAAEILSGLDAPLRLLPGNHDLRAPMRAAFAAQDWEGKFLNFAQEAEGLTMIGLDTVDEGRTAGVLCARRAAWLAEALGAAKGPALIFQHHPPCAMGLDLLDRFEFQGSEDYAAAIAPAPPLRIACGHVHGAYERHWEGTLVAACPAAGVQIPPDAPEGAALGFMLDPPMIRLHDWRAETGLTVKTVPVGPFPGPFPFESDPDADFSGAPKG